MGAEDYLPKPFDPVLLRARINAGLAKKRLHELERERVRSVFSRFVPEHVVSDVLARTDDDLRLGGSREVGTVMFTDIRSFTAFSEATAPHLVIELLNEYFGEMIDAIFGHDGTLVGYRGDGLLAVFGAPIALDDHADRALAAAREMFEVRLPRFNALAARAGPRRRLRDGRRPQQRPVHVRQRRLGTTARVHGPRRHGQHRRAHRGDDEAGRAAAPARRFDLRGARAPPGRP